MNLYYLRDRWMASSLGRFVTVDRYEAPLHNTRALHRYSYAYNNPADYLDPSGQLPNYQYLFSYLSALMDSLLEGQLRPSRIWDTATRREAWKHTSLRWSANDEADFRGFVNSVSRSYVDQAIDCADLAITLLIEFASQRGLPVNLRSQDALYQSTNTFLPSKQWFLSVTKNNIGAEGLQALNTWPKGQGPAPLRDGTAKTGDLLLNVDHVRIFLRYQASTDDVFYIAGDQPLQVAYRHAKPIKLMSTPNLRWWSGAVFNR